MSSKLGAGIPPEGFRARRVSQDGQGRVRAVSSTRDGAAAQPIVPERFSVERVSTLVDADGAPTAQWVIAKPDRRADPAGLVDAFVRAARDVVPARPAPAAPTPPSDDELLTLYVWGDPHIGLLSHARETGSDFDLRIAVDELIASAEMLSARTPASTHALVVDVGDLWHAQNQAAVTPRGGNKLDVDGRMAKVFDEGVRAFTSIIDAVRAKHADTRVAFVPGNHDPDLAVVTRAVVAAYYRLDAGVQVLDNANPWLYHRFGQNLFQFSHGDAKVKPQELGEIMLSDRPDDTGDAKHRVALTGHIHHKQVQEFRWGRWESFNSLCAADFWHHKSGYRSQRLVEAVTYHADYGERSRVRVTREEIANAIR